MPEAQYVPKTCPNSTLAKFPQKLAFVPNNKTLNVPSLQIWRSGTVDRQSLFHQLAHLYKISKVSYIRRSLK